MYEQRLGAGSQLRVGLVAFAFLAPVFIGVAIGIGRLEVIGFAFAWSALLALAAAQSRRAVFKVELVGDQMSIHTCWRTHAVRLDDVRAIELHGSRIDLVNGTSFRVGYRSSAWSCMLECIEELRPNIRIHTPRRELWWMGDTFEQIS